MSVASEIRAVLLRDRDNGEVWEILDTWADFVRESTPLRSKLTRETGWYHHDEQDKTTATPATHPDVYKPTWWPTDESFVFARYANDGTLLSISTYTREAPTVMRNNIRLGQFLPCPCLRAAMWDIGVRRTMASVKDARVVGTLTRAYGRKNYSLTQQRRGDYTDLKWVYDTRPELGQQYDYS